MICEARKRFQQDIIKFYTDIKSVGLKTDYVVISAILFLIRLVMRSN